MCKQEFQKTTQNWNAPVKKKQVRQDSLAEQSKKVARGATPQGHGSGAHNCHIFGKRFDQSKLIASEDTWLESNWRPPACEADVRAIRPQVRMHSRDQADLIHLRRERSHGSARQ